MRFPHDTTKVFCDFFQDDETFLEEWKESGIYEATKKIQGDVVVPIVSDDKVKLLFFLLYSRYANSAIANLDESQFKYKLWSNIFQYGPTWEKKLYVQDKLRALSDDDLIKGAKSINAHSFGMGDDNIVATDDPTKIDQKSSTYFQKSKMEGYAVLLDLLETDVTSEFLNKFKPLFATFVFTKPDIYVTELEDEGDEQ